MQRLDMHQQRLVAQVVPLCIAGTAHEVRVVAGCADKPDYFLSELNRSARDSFFRGKIRLFNMRQPIALHLMAQPIISVSSTNTTHHQAGQRPTGLPTLAAGCKRVMASQIGVRNKNQ